MTSRRDFLELLTVGLPLGMALPGTAFAAPVPAPFNAGQIWQQFKAKHVRSDGRVVDKANGSVSHTEGQGVALLAAATVGDKKAFDTILQFTRRLRREDGLFSWKCSDKGTILDTNNATDGDLYIAWALCRAYKQFGNADYLYKAINVAQAVRSSCIVQSSHGTVLLPGKDGFVQRIGDRQTLVVNPAYWVFPALNELAQIDPSPVWAAATKTGTEILSYAKFGDFGLPADWLLLTDPVIPWRERPARFGYDAIRVPLFLCWGGFQKHSCVKAFAQFARNPGFPAWVSLSDSNHAKYAAPAGFEAVAQLARKSVYMTSTSLPQMDDDYFSSSLTLLASLALSAE